MTDVHHSWRVLPLSLTHDSLVILVPLDSETNFSEGGSVLLRCGCEIAASPAEPRLRLRLRGWRGSRAGSAGRDALCPLGCDIPLQTDCRLTVKWRLVSRLSVFFFFFTFSLQLGFENVDKPSQNKPLGFASNEEMLHSSFWRFAVTFLSSAGGWGWWAGTCDLTLLSAPQRAAHSAPSSLRACCCEVGPKGEEWAAKPPTGSLEDQEGWCPSEVGSHGAGGQGRGGCPGTGLGRSS